MINPAVDDLAVHTTIQQACELLRRPRGSHYRAKRRAQLPPVHGPRPARPAPPNALTAGEQQQILKVLTS